MKFVVKHGNYYLIGENGFGQRKFANTYETEEDADKAIKKLHLEGAVLEKAQEAL